MMHIEPGVVDGAKIVLSYATAAASFGLAAKMAMDTIRKDGGMAALLTRSVITTALVFSFFELLPHYPVGVSEVHLILGSTLFLIFGAGPAAIGLALGPVDGGVSPGIEHPVGAMIPHGLPAGRMIGEVQLAATGGDQDHPLGKAGLKRGSELALPAGEQHLHGK